MDKYYEAYRVFAALINDCPDRVEFRLRPGEMVVFNNRRMLHGRKAFSVGEGSRHFQVQKEKKRRLNQSINQLNINMKNASSSGMLREYRRIQVSSAGGLPAKWSFHKCSSRCQSELLSAKVQGCRFWSVSWRNWASQHVDFAQVDLLIAWRGRNCKKNRISSF